MKNMKKAFSVSILFFIFNMTITAFAASATQISYLHPDEYENIVKNFSVYSSLKNDSLQFAIPGISNGKKGGVVNSNTSVISSHYIPQGITFDSINRKFYMTAYSASDKNKDKDKSNDENSVIFVISETANLFL